MYVRIRRNLHWIFYVFKIQQTIQNFEINLKLFYFINRFWPTNIFICLALRSVSFILLYFLLIDQRLYRVKEHHKIWYSSYFLFNTSLFWMYKHILYISIFYLWYFMELFILIQNCFLFLFLFQKTFLIYFFFIWNNKNYCDSPYSVNTTG